MASLRYPWYMVVNPCCCNNTNPCGDSCGTPQTNPLVQSDNLYYSGPPLPCIGIDTWDSLSTVLQKIEEILCGFTTTTTTTPR